MKALLAFALLPLWMTFLPEADPGCEEQNERTTMTVSADSTEECGAAIVYTIEDDMISIQGTYKNSGSDAMPVRYKLITEKKGTSGTSSNSQGGSDMAQPGETLSLSKVGLDYHPDNHYEITLRILNDKGEVICETQQTISNEK